MKQATRRGTLTVLLLTLAMAMAGSAFANNQDEPFEDTSAVTLVEVPINIVDKNGNPVRGLKASDFTVIDDGKKQQVTAMEVIDLEILSPDRTEISQAVQRLPAVARRHFMLLFDLSFSTPGSIVRARKAARDFVLNHLHATDLAAVATFSIEQGPRLLVTFTPDRAQLARAIDTLGVPGLVRRGQVIDPLRFVIDTPQPRVAELGEVSIDAAGGAPNLDAAVSQHLAVIAMQQEKARKSFARRRISNWSRALGDTAKALASINGRKHVIYFSEGFDGSLLLGIDPSRNTQQSQTDQFLREQGLLWMVDQDNAFGNSGLQSDVAQMLEEFRRADCLIQAVDIGGLKTESSTDGMSNNVVTTRLNDRQDAMFYVADATGGTLFEDANNLGDQLAEMLDRNSVTYVLSYYPSELEADGSYHKLKVKADLPRGTRMSHRSGYYAPKSYEDLHPMEKALLASQAIASATPRNDLELQVLTAPFRASPDLAYVPVILEVPGKPLLSGHTSEALGVEIYIYATNSKGEMRDFVTQVVTFDLRQQRAALYETGIKYYGHLDLVPDDYLIRVLVRNNETGKTAVRSRNLTVPPYEKLEAAVLPPFFLERPNSWFMVREQVSDVRRDTVIYPFTVNGEPFIPSAKPSFSAGEDARFCLVAYNLGEGPIRIDGQVVGSEGVAYDNGELSLIERTITGIDGVDKLIASFNPQELRAGDYTLEVAVTNEETGIQQQNSIAFKVN